MYLYLKAMLSLVEFVFGGNCYRYPPESPWKLTCHLQGDHFKRKIVLQPSFLRGYLSFLGSRCSQCREILHIFFQCLQERLKNRQTIKARLSVLNVAWRKEHVGYMFNTSIFGNVTSGFQEKGQDILETKSGTPIFLGPRQLLAFCFLCGCGVDIECLWAHGYNS